MLAIGRPAPGFTLPDQNGTPVSLEELRGSRVLLYFYPRDDTPGCTTQACAIRDRWSEFEEAGAVVLGVSPDDVASHRRFATTYELPHRLLADPARGTIEAYGAWGWRERRGERIQGVLRSTMLIDRDGILVAWWPKVDPVEHADEVLRTIRELDASDPS